jgi:hypothetical protein
MIWWFSTNWIMESEMINECCQPPTRRQFVRAIPVAGALAFRPGPVRALAEEKSKEEEEVSTNEDLMREHGILKRVLLASVVPGAA